MNVVILGSGGREHALAENFAADQGVDVVYVIPGNVGMESNNNDKIICLEGNILEFESLLNIIKKITPAPELIMVGPEVPLNRGVIDFLKSRGVRAFGPTAAAAQLECSKIFSKEFMVEFNIPTAKFKSFESVKDANLFIDSLNEVRGYVIKADSLAAGKGVVVTDSKEVAYQTVYDFLENPECSVKTNRLIVEEKLYGRELSAFAICDGDNFVVLPSACDYKRLNDGGLGPNTGGMGAYVSHDWPDQNIVKRIGDEVFSRVIEGMKSRGIPFTGVLFAGLIINESGQGVDEQPDISVIEFNVRFGDPETQAILPLCKGGLVNLLIAAADGKLLDLKELNIFEKRESVHIVMSSGGYPSTDGTTMLLGEKINIDFKIDEDKGDYLFFAGVTVSKKGDLVNSGGRVLGITTIRDRREDAVKAGYEIISKIKFKGSHFRHDIGEEK